MGRVIASTTETSAAPETVWALMSDMRTLPEYVVDIERMTEVPDGEVGVGYRYRAYGGVPPFKSDMPWVITEFEPVSRQVHHGDDGMIRMVFTLELVPLGMGTRVDMKVETEARWFLRPIDWMLWPILLRKRAQASMNQTAVNVKRLCDEAATKAGEGSVAEPAAAQPAEPGAQPSEAAAPN